MDYSDNSKQRGISVDFEDVNHEEEKSRNASHSVGVGENNQIPWSSHA